jgi:hypothetical protein
MNHTVHAEGVKMKEKIFSVLVLSTFLLAIFAGKALAAKKFSRGGPEKASVVYPTVDGSEALPNFVSSPVIYEVGKTADCFAIHPDAYVHVLEHNQWGSTYYDYQSNGSMGRMIAVGPGGYRHMICHETRGPYPANPRYITYNCKDPLNNWLAPTWIDGGTDLNAGYANIGVLHDGRAVVVYHRNSGTPIWYTSLIVQDSGQICSDHFSKKYDLPDWLQGPWSGMWPKMGILYDSLDTDYIHIVMTEATPWGDNFRLGYLRCHFIAGDTLFCETPIGQSGVVSPTEVVPNVPGCGTSCPIAYFGECEAPGVPPGEYPSTISAVVATSPGSQKVGIVFTNKREVSSVQVNNDVFYFESTNNGNSWFPQYGGTWPPKLANGMLHNISNYQTTDMERAYTDVSACYDYNDNLHVVWTGCFYDSVAGLISNDANLYHWSQATGISLVAPGYWGGTAPGGWNRNISKMSISAQDPIYHGGVDSVYLFCTWTQFDSGDVSAGEYSNGDIYASASKDSGRTWTPGFNLTNTKTLDCDSANCLSEHWSSLAENVYDGDLHIEYVCDKNAGDIIRSKGVWTDNSMMYMRVQQLPATLHCGAIFLNQDPASWVAPPIKIPPSGSRWISFKLRGIYNLGGNYEVTTDVPGATVTPNPSGYLAPGQEKTVGINISCTGQAFKEGNVYIKTCKATVDEKTINLPVYAVCSDDYYECMRDPATQIRKGNDVCSLWVCSNTEEQVWDKRLPADSNQVIFSGGVIAGFISGTDTIVGRQDYRDARTGARDTIKAVRDPVFGFSSEPDCDLQKIHVAKTYIWYPPTIPAVPQWYWITINQQIILFHDSPGHTCAEWKKEQVIKHVWVTWGRYPGWWPSPGAYTGHPDIYYGVFADVDAPFDTGCRTMGGESQSGCNAGGWDDVNKIVWQHGFAGLNHPEYANYYVGMALTNTAGAVVTPLGCKDVQNDVYLYPNDGWGWKDGELYELAATPLNPATVVDNPDSVVDRCAVITAGKIPAGGATDTLFNGKFILIEALIKTGLDDLKSHIVDTRGTLIPELASIGVFSKIFPVCGDVNGDGKVNASDVVYLINHLGVPNSPAPPWPMCRADVNNDGSVNWSDVVYLINYQFVANSPHPNCPCVWN